MRYQQLADRRERHALRGAVEDRRPYRAFERLDLPRERGLRCVEALSCLVQAAILRDMREGKKAGHVPAALHNMAGHRRREALSRPEKVE